MTWVKYTLGLKHQVSKQRGEEYRAHGQHGWLWLSSARRFTPTDARTVGLRAGPHRLAVKYTDIRNNSFKIVLMEPKAFKYLVAKQEKMENSKENNDKDSSESASKTESDDSKIGIEKKKLEQALKNARLEHQIPTKDMFDDVVDVSAGLSNPTRILYSKVAKKAQYLDDFLARRLQLKSLEERRIELKTGIKPTPEPTASTTNTAKKPEAANGGDGEEGFPESMTSITSDMPRTAEDKERDFKKCVDKAKKAIWNVLIPKLDREANKALAKGLLSDPQPGHRPETLICYSAQCKAGKGCYSITCQKYSHNISPNVREAFEMIKGLIEEGKKHGYQVTSTLCLSDSPAEAVSALKNLVKNLMKTKDEVRNIFFLFTF